MAEDRERGEEPEAAAEAGEPEPAPDPEPAPAPEPDAAPAPAPEPDPDPEASAGEPESEEAKDEKKPKPLPGAGTEEGDQLRAAHRAFELGDYRRVRALSDALLEARDGEVAANARELRARTGIDPVQVGVVLACLVLLSLIAYVYVL